MGAVFAMFSGWYYWVPKILGLNYNMLLSKVHFWVLFIGVNHQKGRLFEKGKRLFSSTGKGGSPLDPVTPSKWMEKEGEFFLFFDNVKEKKKTYTKN